MCNIGTLDRVMRFVVGAVLLSMVFVGPESLWGWIGIIPVTTAIICHCPVYAIVGFNSCKKQD